MIAILLGILLPIGYVIMASAIGFRIRRSSVGCRPDTGDRYASICTNTGHSYLCSNSELAVVGGVLWPLVPLIFSGYLLATKKPIHGHRIRKAEKVAKRIAEMETELYGKAFK